MTEKLCLRRKSWTKMNPGQVLDPAAFFHIEKFANCLGDDCPLHIPTGTPEDKNYCLDLLLADAQLTTLIYGNPPPEKKSENKSKLNFVKCKRCGCNYGHSDTELCSRCQVFSAKETDSKK